MASLLSAVKEAAMAAVHASNPMIALYGEVTGTNPLEVTADQRLKLTADFLIVPELLTHKEIELPSPYNSKIVLRQGLKAGDKVILLRTQGGQQYIIADRVVGR